MNLHSHVDLYCERLDAGFWSEPVNALTNMTFLLVLPWIWVSYQQAHTARQETQHDWLILITILLGALVGLGSFLFHTFATVWSSLADIIPIWLFVAFYLFAGMYRFLELSLKRTLFYYALLVLSGGIVLFINSQVLLATNGQVASTDSLNGSTQYLPGIVLISGMLVYLYRNHHAARHWLMAAACAFCVALFFRSVDLAVCSRFPLGTHFLWHSVNSLSFAFLLQGLIRHGGRRHVDTASDYESSASLAEQF